MAAEIAQALQGILPAGMVLGEPVAGEGLWPEEAISAVPKRVAEFTAGRSAARAALAGLGLRQVALPMAPDRSVTWPLGVTGSISHCAGACLAVVGDARWAGVGLDLEPDQPLEAELWPEILRDEELLWLQAQPEEVRQAKALRVFVAKEAAYKAQFSQSRALFGFHQLSLRWSGDRFTARFMSETTPFPTGFEFGGQIVTAGGFVAALVGLLA